MSDKKRLGVYYTPKILCDFVASHYFKYYYEIGARNLSVLEPSAGDASMLLSLVSQNIKSLSSLSIQMIDVNREELELGHSKLIDLNLSQEVSVNTYNGDFLFYENATKFDLIIGNPPYISKRDLSADQILRCNNIQNEITTSKSEVKNIWTSFMLRIMEMVKSNGTICQILPVELLHVNYTRILRSQLMKNFKRVEIFTFKEIIFKDTQQDVIILFASNSISCLQSGISFYEVNKLEDLELPNYTEKYFNIHRSTQDKWASYILKDEELEFLENFKKEYKLAPIIDYCHKIEVGLVTGANDFFIVNKEVLIRFDLSKYAQLIFKGGFKGQTRFRISEEAITDLEDKGEDTYLLVFPNVDRQKLSLGAQEYLHIGEKLKLHLRYKMKKRNRWYCLPLKWRGKGLFPRRIHNSPLITVNEADVNVTDTMYMIKNRSSYCIESMACSFHNLATYIDLELKGRYYGGGVLELTPNEFKSVDIPHYNYSVEKITEIDRLITGGFVNDALKYNHSILFPSISIDSEESLRTIYNKLLNRRLKR